MGTLLSAEEARAKVKELHTLSESEAIELIDRAIEQSALYFNTYKEIPEDLQVKLGSLGYVIVKSTPPESCPPGYKPMKYRISWAAPII